MEYNFREIEKKWQDAWKESGIYHVSNTSGKLKCYVLDMFPYPSGAGLHVGHPLGYIASDIYARYKRLKGFNVLHPMGFDSFGLPAEQYALETGQHPAITTEKNIATFKEQLDKIGFCFDWSREVKTSDPEYYRWTQWIFLQLFKSWYNPEKDKAESIETLIKEFEENGSGKLQNDNKCSFTADEWKNFDEKKQQDILMDFRLAFSSYGEVNWCEALGTVLANDEVVNGVSERGGHPVEKKKMRQWYLRITDYADRLLKGLETVDFSDAMKEMQRNWIGRSEGAEVEFEVKSLTPGPSPRGEGGREETSPVKTNYRTSDKKFWPLLKDLSRENRKEKTPLEDKLWQALRGNKLGAKVRRQHVIDGFIIDFAFLNEKLLIEVDGDYHNDLEQKEYDNSRGEFLESLGYRIIRFTNDEIRNHFQKVIEKIKNELAASPLSPGRGDGGEAKKSEAFSIKVYTTRPDTIFGVDFLVLAPEHELVNEITTKEQRQSIDEYITYVKSRSDRERLAEVKQITGCFTGSYAINPFDGKQIPIWISEYVLAGYGTGAIMAVPCGDERDFNFATHFNIPITNIIGSYFDGKEANPTKDAILENSGFLNGLVMKDAIGVATDKIEELGIGKRKVNYKMRDAGFSRQRYWGEPFPIIWSDGIAIPLDEKELPLELPFVEKYGPGRDGEGPLSNLRNWVNVEVNEVPLHSDFTPVPSPKERGEGDAGYITSDASTWKTLKPFARENRKEQTDAEKLLWANLRNRNISNCKFRRQHAIGSFIVDFVCIEKKLVIEVEGDYHLDEEQKKYDKLRTEFLQESGFTELRFSNEDIQKNISASLQKIREYLREEHPPLLWRGVRGEVKSAEGARETSTMPGYAGSSWYFLRYMDPHNNETFADRKATDYWNQVDVYIGGTEHAVGHLLYSRMWTKFLYDLGLISFDEPYKKLVNQGMITGNSYFVIGFYALKLEKAISEIEENQVTNKRFGEFLISNENYDKGFSTIFQLNNEEYRVEGVEQFQKTRIRYAHFFVDSKDRLTKQNLIKTFELDNLSSDEISEAISYIFWDGKTENGEDFIQCKHEVEKMSKSKYNTVNPNEIVDKYGADTFRMYEMFLGPVEQSKPWDTKGIEGVHRFLKKLWRLFYDEIKGPIWTSSPLSPGRGAGGEASPAELKILHKTIKKIEEDTERFSFNTAVSAFMVCVNELSDLKCHKKEILEPLLIMLTPYAPHIAEELYHALGNTDTILNAPYPKLENKYLVESEKEYPISINGKMRTTMVISLEATQQEVEKLVLENETVQKWIDSKPIKKVIFVKNKMVNVVV